MSTKKSEYIYERKETKKLMKIKCLMSFPQKILD